MLYKIYRAHKQGDESQELIGNINMTILFNPNTFTGEDLDPATRELFFKTIDWFEKKGLTALKQDDMYYTWYDDFIRFQKEEKLFATLLTPAGYGEKTSRYDLNRITQFNELLAFYSMAHRYVFQVSILGTGPIWMSDNEVVKQRTAALLQQGEIFGFGVSEKEHGADLYSNETTLTPCGEGKYKANGNKYYIGNSNKGYISTIGKISETGEYVFFQVDSKHRNYKDQKRIVTLTSHCAYVGQYELVEYPITEDDIISRGDKALQDALKTVNIGKFQVGVVPVGCLSHALYESINHCHNRVIYGKKVTDFQHIQELFVESFCRLTAMKLYNNRTLDYLRTASDQDRRYLIYTPVSKMKVGMQGAKIADLLLDTVAAKGYETETYLEMCFRDVQASPRLEGTAHVNMQLILKFINNYLFGDTAFPVPKRQKEPTDYSNLFNQTFGNMRSIKFPDCTLAYESNNLPNVTLFKEQLVLLQRFFREVPPSPEKSRNLAYMYNLGEMFTLAPYAQLILESSPYHKIDDILLNKIFGYLVGDFSAYALKQITLQNNEKEQDVLLYQMLKKPLNDDNEFNTIWKEHVEVLDGAYKMTP